MKDSAPELNVSSSETEEDKEEAKPDGEKDPDFNQVCIEGLCIIVPSFTPCSWCFFPGWDLFSILFSLELISFKKEKVARYGGWGGAHL